MFYRVQVAADRQPRLGKRNQGFAQIHISFISRQNRFIVNEKCLRDIFEYFGPVVDVTIKQHNYAEVSDRPDHGL
jgi:hypothetical protein